MQDAQKDCPARPQRVKDRGVPSWYVEDLIEVRTLLADFFSILLGIDQIVLKGATGERSPSARGLWNRQAHLKDLAASS